MSAIWGKKSKYLNECGITFQNRNSQPFYFIRQCGQSHIYSILDIKGSYIYISADIKSCGDRTLPTGSTITGKISHSQRSVNLCFERSCGRLLYSCRIGANEIAAH